MDVPVLLPSDRTNTRVIDTLKNGGVVVMPTDTIYGIVGSALLPATVERIFQLRQRDPGKPVIFLIADITDLEQFAIALDDQVRKFLASVWPGAVSVILPAPSSQFDYLHRGTHTLAFRLPKNDSLRDFLRQSGPLVAPSANIAGKPAATTIAEAMNSFGNTVSLYLDGGTLSGEPSTLVRFSPDGITILRQGSTIVPTSL